MIGCLIFSCDDFIFVIYIIDCGVGALKTDKFWNHFGVFVAWALYILVLRGGGGSFLWEYMEPLNSLDFLLTPEWEEYKVLAYLMEGEISYISSS